jgi:hypothetical protein
LKRISELEFEFETAVGGVQALVRHRSAEMSEIIAIQSIKVHELIEENYTERRFRDLGFRDNNDVNRE